MAMGWDTGFSWVRVGKISIVYRGRCPKTVRSDKLGKNKENSCVRYHSRERQTGREGKRETESEREGEGERERVREKETETEREWLEPKSF